MIPRIIHQIWIGDVYKPPLELMATWKECAAQLNIEYILWTDDEIKKRGIVFECETAINEIPEINGKADIMRWEILLKYGGIFIDADSICVEPLIEDFFTPQNLIKDSLYVKVPPPPTSLLKVVELSFDDDDETSPPFVEETTANDAVGFAAFENEQVRPNLIATGTMGFTPNHPLVSDIVKWLKSADMETIMFLKTKKAWITVGPGCITRFLETMQYKETMVIFPSHYFIPIHYAPHSKPYTGHQKVYAHQLWGTGEQQYGKMTANIPPLLLPPTTINEETAVSVLVINYNNAKKWIHECLQSIQNQKGKYMIELVWIDCGGAAAAANELEWFKRTTRFLMGVHYHKMGGGGDAFDYGVKLCTNELIIKMDSYNIMFSKRIQKQIQFMNENPQVICCGGQLIQFEEIGGEKVIRKKTNYPLVITEQIATPNIATLCYRKWAIDEVGGGGAAADDAQLCRNIFNYFGEGSICNIPDYLILYRIYQQ